jgi:hypothetical protein
MTEELFGHNLRGLDFSVRELELRTQNPELKRRDLFEDRHSMMLNRGDLWSPAR